MDSAVTSSKAMQADPGDPATAIEPRRASASRFAGIGRLLRSAWRYLRETSGDDAYERYVEHLALAHPGEPAMSRAQYFRLRQEQKWDGIKRCC
jgi:uncharacterized short protein YbdD (DUF466 family)